MSFTDNLLKSILQKAFEIQKWAILAEHYDETRVPACYGDTLTYRLSVGKQLNLYDILDQLRYDGQGDYARELKKNRDELLEGVESFDENIDRNHKHHLPNFCLCDTAHGLFKKLRRIVEEQTDDNKKLLLYAECIEDLIKDDTKLYPQIWRGEFEKLLDIVVSHLLGYDLFGELLGRIKEKDSTAAAQLKKKYDQLIILSNVENAHKEELKAVESAAFDLVSLMREIAEKEPEIPPAKRRGIVTKITGWILKKTSHFIFAVIVAIIAAIIAAIVIDILVDFGLLEQIKAFIYKILRLT